jgi:hypothetical protein
LPRPKVQRTPHADYLFRAVVNKQTMAGVLASLTEGIDYDNFKDAVASKQGIERARVYHDVWNVLRPLQLQPPKLTLVKSKPKIRRGGVSFGTITGAELDAIERAKAEREASERRIAAMPPALVDLFTSEDCLPSIETDADTTPDTSAEAHYAALKKTMHPLTFARLYDQSKGEGIVSGNSTEPPGETFAERVEREMAALSGAAQDPPLKPPHERDPPLGKKI